MAPNVARGLGRMYILAWVLWAGFLLLVSSLQFREQVVLHPASGDTVLAGLIRIGMIWVLLGTLLPAIGLAAIRVAVPWIIAGFRDRRS